MKQFFRFGGAAAALLVSVILTFTACDNSLDGASASGSDVGYVSVSLAYDGAALSQAARTVLPGTFIFDHYQFDFSSETAGNTTVARTSAEAGGAFSLKPADDWYVTVKAYLTSADTISAQGTSADPFKIEAGATTSAVSVSLAPVSAASMTSGTGTFTCTVTFPEGAEVTAFKLGATDLSEGAALTSTQISKEVTGITSGYLPLYITLSKDGKEAGKSEVAHVYNGQTTTVTWSFTEGDFQTMLSASLAIDSVLSGAGFTTVDAVTLKADLDNGGAKDAPISGAWTSGTTLKFPPAYAGTVVDADITLSDGGGHTYTGYYRAALAHGGSISVTPPDTLGTATISGSPYSQGSTIAPASVTVKGNFTGRGLTNQAIGNPLVTITSPDQVILTSSSQSVTVSGNLFGKAWSASITGDPFYPISTTAASFPPFYISGDPHDVGLTHSVIFKATVPGESEQTVTTCWPGATVKAVLAFSGTAQCYADYTVGLTSAEAGALTKTSGSTTQRVSTAGALHGLDPVEFTFTMPSEAVNITPSLTHTRLYTLSVARVSEVDSDSYGTVEIVSGQAHDNLLNSTFSVKATPADSHITFRKWVWQDEYNTALIGPTNATYTTTFTSNITLYAIFQGDGSDEAHAIIVTNANGTELPTTTSTASLAKYYKLAVDITTAVTTPIGDANNKFTGGLNGNGHTVPVNITTPVGVGYQTYGAGLFGALGSDTVAATVRNLRVTGTVNITQDATASSVPGGGVAAYVYQGTIENVLSEVNVSVAYTYSGGTGSVYAGGVAGDVVNTGYTIRNCVSTGTVSGSADAGKCYVGGIVGNVTILTGNVNIFVNCAAFNSSISGSYSGSNGSVARVVGLAPTSATKSNNYALSSMTVNGEPLSPSANKGHAHANGADIETPAWDFFTDGSNWYEGTPWNEAIWEWDGTNSRPKLR
ncbi:MAG: hypothetical protein LBR16_07025 [Treponema sp.]|jgi:hypothetical protein|nr:hypothetical protein [Treponema sp.]